MTATITNLAEKLPPSSVDAEQALLGSLLLDRDALLVVGDQLHADDFHRDAHRLVYESMLRLQGRGVSPDVVTLVDELEASGHLQTAGGVAYIHSLATVVPTAIHVQHYAADIRETAQKRRLIRVGGLIAGMGYDGTITSADVLSEAARMLTELTSQAADRGGHISTVSLPKELSVKPIPLAHPHLAKVLRGGFRPGVSYVAAAPPGGLKSAFLIDAELTALLACYGVVHVTNELPNWIMRERYLAHLGRYDLGRALENHLQGWEIEAREDATATLNQMPLHLFESIPTVDEIGLRLAKAKAQEKSVLGWMLVLDYIQRLRGDGKSERRHVIADSFDRLQEIARNEGVALLVASSLAMSDWNSPPDLWGGRESGDIKGYTSVFLGLKRDKDADALTPGKLNLAIHVTKNTLGPETVLPYLVETGPLRFEEADRQDEPRPSAKPPRYASRADYYARNDGGTA